MAVTVPADIAQFFWHIIRILQKLVYLYGWQEMLRGDEDALDDETTNQRTLFVGVMFGVNAANAVITKIASVAASRAEKALVQKALTKGAIYPNCKKSLSTNRHKNDEANICKEHWKNNPRSWCSCFRRNYVYRLQAYSKPIAEISYHVTDGECRFL